MLVEDILRGNATAFAQLVREYQTPLLASAYHLLGNAEDAQDLAQETFIEAFRRLPALRDGDKLRGWLFTILRRKCLRFLQEHRHIVMPLEQVEGLLVAPAPTLADEQLWEVLQRLPLRDREILAARYLQEMSYTEIAASMSISPHGAEMRCARARARLRDLLREKEEEDARAIMQRAMSALPIGLMGDHFVHQVLQEVTPMMNAQALSAASPLKTMTSLAAKKSLGLPSLLTQAAGWKAFIVVAVTAMLIGGMKLTTLHLSTAGKTMVTTRAPAHTRVAAMVPPLAPAAKFTPLLPAMTIPPAPGTPVAAPTAAVAPMSRHTGQYSTRSIDPPIIKPDSSNRIAAVPNSTPAQPVSAVAAAPTTIAPPLVQDISFRGLEHLSPDMLAEINKIVAKAQIGRPYDEPVTQVEKTALLALGWYTNVDMSTEPVDGGIRLVFTLKEMPTVLQVTVTGMKNLTAAQQQSVMAYATALRNLPLNKKTAGSLKDLGWFSRVSYDTKSITGGIDLLFSVSENPVVTGIVFTGNTQLTAAELTKVVNSQGVHIGEVLNRNQVGAAGIAIEAAYAQQGYSQSRIHPSETFTKECSHCPKRTC